MFGKKIKKQPYDKQNQKPVIRASICTGEQVAGFRDKKTGRFQEVMLIKRQADLDLFCNTYVVDQTDISKEY